MLTAISLGFAALSLWGAVNLALEGTYEVMSIFLGFAMVFGLLGTGLAAFIKNYALLFCEEEMIFRMAFGRRYACSYKEAEG